MERRILVLDGNQRASLAAVRSLGGRGLWVAVAETGCPSLAGTSKHCASNWSYPCPEASPRLFFDTLLELIKELGITFLLPITESTSYTILRYREELPDSVIIPFPSQASVEKLSNKNELCLFASRHRISIPLTRFCQDRKSGLETLEQLKVFPVVLKPCKSKIMQKDSILPTKVLIAKDSNEAKDLIKENAFFEYPFTIQEYIDGSGQGIFALYNHGQPVCYFSHRRMREKPPGGGVSVLSESSPIDDGLKEAAEKLLSSAQWHGVAMVEFRVAGDGKGYLMEVNPRFWGSLQLAIDSGVDFPWLLYLTCTGQPLPEIKWRHRRVRWLLGDLDRLFIILKAPFSKYSPWHKLLEILRFVLPTPHTRHEVNRWSDPKPFWFEVKEYIRTLQK